MQTILDISKETELLKSINSVVVLAPTINKNDKEVQVKVDEIILMLQSPASIVQEKMYDAVTAIGNIIKKYHSATDMSNNGKIYTIEGAIAAIVAKLNILKVKAKPVIQPAQSVANADLKQKIDLFYKLATR